MIAKIGRGSNLFGALQYNHLKIEQENGQILNLHKMAESINGSYSVSQLARNFEPYLLANNKTEKPIIHISLNPDPNDNVDDNQFKALAHQYMQEMGYGNQPFVVFKHTDIDRTHIHIVSVCVDENGRKIPDNFEKRRSMKVCRDLEQKFNLIPAVEKEESLNDNVFKPVDITKGDLKSQLASVVRYISKYYGFQSLGEYNALLSLFNVTAEEVKGHLRGIDRQGLVYFVTDKNGCKISNPFKASLFGKAAGYPMLQQHLKFSEEKIKKEKNITGSIQNTVQLAMYSSTDEKSFKAQLQEQDISTVVRRNAEGRIYGITFIDHNSKIVLNGSRLGKNYSAAAFNDWWTLEKSSIMKLKDGNKSSLDLQAKPGESGADNIFEFLTKPETKAFTHSDDFITGLSGLLPDSFGDDPEELLFENQIKKKKKKKKKKRNNK